MPTTIRDGVRLGYDVTGEGPPLLLVPGFAAERSFWAGLGPRLPGRTLVLPDPRGAGESDAPEGPYDVDTLAHDLVAVLAAAGVTTPVDIAGHSLGGAVALRLAALRPDLVRRVVVLQSFARAGATCRRALGAALSAYDDDPAPMAELARTLFPWLFSARFLADDATYASLVALSVQAPNPQPRAGYAGQLAALEGHDATAWATAVQAPVLVVAADEDVLVPAADTRELATLLGADLLTVHGAAHCAPVERPDAVATLVRGFLSW